MSQTTGSPEPTPTPTPSPRIVDGTRVVSSVADAVDGVARAAAASIRRSKRVRAEQTEPAARAMCLSDERDMRGTSCLFRFPHGRDYSSDVREVRYRARLHALTLTHRVEVDTPSVTVYVGFDREDGPGPEADARLVGIIPRECRRPTIPTMMQGTPTGTDPRSRPAPARSNPRNRTPGVR